MTPYFTLLFTAFLLALTGMILHRTHLISLLLNIEAMMLTLYFIMMYLSLRTSTPATSTTPLLLLTLSACEAGTGLGLLVATIRTHSSDHMNSINILQC